jgi:hypothetical protein
MKLVQAVFEKMAKIYFSTRNFETHESLYFKHIEIQCMRVACSILSLFYGKVAKSIVRLLFNIYQTKYLKKLRNKKNGIDLSFD